MTFSPRAGTGLLAALLLAGPTGACGDTPATETKAPAAETPTAAPAVPAKPPAPKTAVKTAVKTAGVDPALQQPVSAEQIDALISTLSDNVRAGATDPSNAWALGHGLVAFGGDLKASDGRLAAEVILSDFGEPGNDGSPVQFAAYTADRTPVQPHPHLVAKSLLEAGIDRTQKLSIRGGGKVTLAEMIADIEAKTGVPQPQDDPAWRQAAWGLGVMFEAGKPTAARDELARAALNYIEVQQAFLTKLMREDAPERVQKRKQFIYAHSCGGIHLLQSAMLGASRLPDPGTPERIRTQLDTLAFRVRAESAIYRDAREGNPEYATLILTQELKFFGHALETFALAHSWGQYPLDVPHRAMLTELVHRVQNTTAKLKDAYADLAAVRADNRQIYLDLIGDGCHAIHALKLARPLFAQPKDAPPLP